MEHSSSFYCHSRGLLLDNNNNVWSFGKNHYGELGKRNYFDLSNLLSDMNFIYPLKQIRNLSNIIMISCGTYHSICLDHYNIVYSFGCNSFGQLGLSRNIRKTDIPQKLQNLPLIKQISCSPNSTFCLTKYGDIFSFGRNEHGEIGNGSVSCSSFLPKQIQDLENIEYISCFGYHIFCKSYTENEFYCWGNNNMGQLGQGNNDAYLKPTLCLNWPNNIISIKSGLNHTLLLTAEGQVYSFGNNNNGELGINDETIKITNIPILINDLPEIKKIECGHSHSICIDIDDNIWLCGCNKQGQLGLGDKMNRYKPIIHPTLSNITDISRGNTFIKTIDNKIYGIGDKIQAYFQVPVIENNNLYPIQVLKGKEDIWSSFISKNKAKSARK